MNFQESEIILNAYTKKVLKLIVCTLYMRWGSSFLSMYVWLKETEENHTSVSCLWTSEHNSRSNECRNSPKNLECTGFQLCFQSISSLFWKKCSHDLLYGWRQWKLTLFKFQKNKQPFLKMAGNTAESNKNPKFSWVSMVGR